MRAVLQKIHTVYTGVKAMCKRLSGSLRLLFCPFKLHPNAVARYIQEGKLKGVKVGKGY